MTFFLALEGLVSQGSKLVREVAALEVTNYFTHIRDIFSDDSFYERDQVDQLCVIGVVPPRFHRNSIERLVRIAVRIGIQNNDVSKITVQVR